MEIENKTEEETSRETVEGMRTWKKRLRSQQFVNGEKSLYKERRNWSLKRKRMRMRKKNRAKTKRRTSKKKVRKRE